jgi:hypothetical protein
LPDQILQLNEYTNVEGWVLHVDKMLISEEYGKRLENIFIRKAITLNENQTKDLESCISMLDSRLKGNPIRNNQSLILSLLSSITGIFIEIYGDHGWIEMNGRPAIITAQFKYLLSVHYKTIKSPSGYAAKINISKRSTAGFYGPINVNSCK